ncbi:MAG: hypothetical protein AUG16_05320 [Thaumarchaeota archaeon 13_1_20CM_2_39_20]|nr:MAG: hypothetical protein AUI59_01775 [Thaumarchaeota archaeon 13_1_40CM_2_39_13_1]OLE40184.1 MAG: hypothetical protein AUG16_05320 [Thaumarchaeota archaeon 13_1_20CM_2_39_20]
MDIEKFTEDVYTIAEKLTAGQSPEIKSKINFVRERLIELYQKNLVKINHSVLEIICASNLISQGYTVDIEKHLSEILICDVFATKGDGTFIMEIETGFTPPDHALDTIDYYVARIGSKIARYSQYCSKFALATPVVGILPIPKLFLKPPGKRTKDEIQAIKDLVDRFYKNPPIEINDIVNARLHSVYLINIDKCFAKQVDPYTYLELTEKLQEASELDL